MSGPLVIVGASHAGVQAAVSLRQSGWQEPITLISSETDLPYHRPPLSKAYLAGEKTADQILLRAEDFYAAQDIDLQLGVKVEEVSTQEHKIRTTGGDLPYSRLVLATGASARPLAVEGADLDGIHMLRDMADARKLKTAFEAVDRLVIIGGGFIGLEVAASAAKAGKQVTVIEVQDRLLARALPPMLSDWIAGYHRAKGVDIRLAEPFDTFEGENGKLTGVRLKSGERLPTELVLVGIGSIANLQLAEQIGLECQAGGIKVDDVCRTSAPGIFAIGDCASQYNVFAREIMRVESVQNASDQARVLAALLTDKPIPAPGANWFWTDQYDLKFQMAGLLESDCEEIVRGDPDTGAFSILLMKNGALRALFSVNKPADHMAARKFIAAATPLDTHLCRDAGTPLPKAVL